MMKGFIEDISSRHGGTKKRKVVKKYLASFACPSGQAGIFLCVLA
jgi:hypothetical protein